MTISDAGRSAAGYDLTAPDAAAVRTLAEALSAEERRILLHHGTEPPFCGTLLDTKQTGAYCCRLCGLPLFRSSAKFNSGTGWPSFHSPFDPAHLATYRDASHGMVRVEIRCGRCDGHQGHVFPDGPPPTGQRYCLNSASLTFVPTGDPMPDLLDRGESRPAP